MRALRRAAIIGAGQQLGMVYDRFNRADGDIGTADSGETWDGNYSPIGWVVISGKAKRSAATVSATVSAVSIDIPVSTGDYSVSADITVPTTDETSGVFGRGYIDCAYSVAATISNTRVYLVTISSARELNTAIASYLHSLTVGTRHNIKLVMSGTSAYVFLDGVQVISNTISAWSGSDYLGVGMVSRRSTAAPTSLFGNFRAF